MAYSNSFDITKPAGSDPANVDDDLRALKAGINERFNDVFGFNFQTDDPLLPSKIGPALTIQGAQIGTAIYDAGNSGTSKTIDWNNGDQQKVTLTGNVTFTFTNVVAGRNYVLYLVQDATGSRFPTFPATVRTSSGLAFSGSAFQNGANRLNIAGFFSYTTTRLVGTYNAVDVDVS